MNNLYVDALTGLKTREAFLPQATAALRVWHRDGHAGNVAILVLDLDRLRLLSDTMGIKAGDRLVATVGGRLSQVLRPTDSVARIGDGMFALLLCGLAQPEHAGIVAARVREAISKPVQIFDSQFHASASFGLALAHQGSLDAEMLISHASAACFSAQKKGPGQIELYDDRMHMQMSENLALDGLLREAIKNGELEAWFQPLVTLDGHQTRGFEALARWRHPSLGMISPAKFIPLAESNGLIKPLGNLMLDQSLAQVAAWRAQGHEKIFVSVNVSAQQLEESGFVAHISARLQAHGLPPECLHLEITESCLVLNPEKTRVALEMLRDLGVSISLDDFGTGYSCFSSLHQFPIHTLKIDRSLLPPHAEAGRQRQLFESLCALALGLGLKIVIEGIEDEEQASLAKYASGGLGQGFLWSKALAPGDATAWLVSAAPNN